MYYDHVTSHIIILLVPSRRQAHHVEEAMQASVDPELAMEFCDTAECRRSVVVSNLKHSHRGQTVFWYHLNSDIIIAVAI